MKEQGDDDGMRGRRVPYAFLPFQTPLCPFAMEREKRMGRMGRRVRKAGRRGRPGVRRVPRERCMVMTWRRKWVMAGEWTHCSSSHEKDKVTGRTVQGEKMTENHRRFVWSDSVLNCPLVPGGTRPSRSRPWFLSLTCSTAGSRSRWCRPLPARCGTAGSGRSGPCSWETLRGITEPAWGKISMAKNDQLSRDSSIITAAPALRGCWRQSTQLSWDNGKGTS